MQKKILIIGISGFIGRNLLDDLLKKNYEIHGTFFTAENKIEQENIQFCKRKSIKLYFLDLIKQENYKNIPWSEYNFIFICAAISRPMQIKMPRYFDVNTIGSLMLLDNINNSKSSTLEKVIYTSSVSVLGTSPNEKELKEDDFCFTEDLYSLSKRYGENIAMFFLKNKILPITIYRPCLTYGKYQDLRLIIYRFIKLNIFPLFSKNVKFEFLYIKNFTNLLIQNLEKNNDIHNYFNVTDGKSYTLENLIDNVSKYYKKKYFKFYIPKTVGFVLGFFAEYIYKIFNKHPPFSRTAAYWMSKSINIYSCEKAKQILNYKPEYNMENGLKETLDWLKKK